MKQSKLSEFHDDPIKSKEPALKAGLSVTTVAGVLSLVNFFAPNLIDDKANSFILVGVAFLLPIITAIFTRPFVWSPASVEDLLEEAVESAEEVKKNQGPKLI